MVTVLLHNHEFIYPLQDVLRLFYGSVQQLDGQRLSADPGKIVDFAKTGGDVVIHSIRHGSGVIESRIESDGAADKAAAGAHDSVPEAGSNVQRPIVSKEPITDEITQKREVKRQLYYLLSELTDMKFPWGSLTGIRPTYVARQLIDQHGIDAARRLLEDFYFVSPEKADLALVTAENEDHLMRGFDEQDLALYVGIPFCPTRCSYCSFSSPEGIGRPSEEMDRYLDALTVELSAVWQSDEMRKQLGQSKVRAVYIGGGTPTALSAQQLQRLFHMLGTLDIPFTECCERTIEAGRPDTINREKLERIRDYAFTRISINPQSMNDATLDRIGRSHSKAAIIRVMQEAKSVGFRDINMDLIAGLAGETAADFSNSLAEVLALEPDSVSVHNLAVKRSSRLHRLITEADTAAAPKPRSPELLIRKRFKPDEEIAAMLLEARHELELRGYRPYYLYRQKNGLGSLENASFSKKGKGCLYNIAMMGDMRSVISFGACSISKRVIGDRLERSANLRNIGEYNRRSAEMAKRKIDLFSTVD